MKRILSALLIFLILNSEVSSQYADLGTGNLKNYIWWFDWNGFTISNGASRTITTADGLTATITFSNVQGPVFTPKIMNTWYGSVLHFLYDFSNPNIKPALSSPYTTQNSQFTITISATRNGIPAAFKFIAADAEASAVTELTTLTTNGSNWLCVDFFRNSSQTSNPFAGCNTNTAIISDTYGGGSSGNGQNPVIATDAPASGSLTVNCNFNRSNIEGEMAIAFGIFSPVDRGDLPVGYGYAHHRLEFTNNNSCSYLPPLPSLTQSETLKLGSIAGDADPTESNNDNTIGADEDAVSSLPYYMNSGSYSLDVNLRNNTGNNAYLTGWFDFNRNGVFENNEYVTNTIPNNTTTSTLTWTGLPATFPPGTVTGWAFRLRLSSNIASTQNSSGFAPDGEVEDYFATSLQISTPGFTAPDTVCVNTPVTITNTSTNATTSFWNFCTGNINSTPGGTNLGNIGGQFQLPVFIDYAEYNGNYYGFVTNNTPGKLTRLDFGNSLLNTPTTVNIGNVGGVIPDFAEAIQLVFNEGKWYAIIIGGTGPSSRIVKIDFGPNLTNTNPVGTNWGNLGGPFYPRDIQLVNENGNWYAFTIDAGSALIRYSFGSSFDNVPTAFPFGIVHPDINLPTGIHIINDNGQWHAFIASNGSNSSIVRLDFGNSIVNAPTAVGLGNPNNAVHSPRDICIMKFCSEVVGFVVNSVSNDIVRLNFSSLTSTPTAVSLGNIGNLSNPRSISKFFRVGADLYSFIPNESNNTITRINFNGCNNSSIPNYSGTTPPAIAYTTPGTYNINLTIDDGLPTQSSTCKQIVVLGKPDIDFTYQLNACNPLSVQFNGIGSDTQNPLWWFGDTSTNSGNLAPVHIYPSENNYTVSYTAGIDAACPDTIVKTISLSIVPDNIIRTSDTTICFGTTKQLLTIPSTNFCWSPTTYLSDPNSPNPVTNTPENITYYYTAEITGNNLIVNGDFSQGNTGFTSQYTYKTPPNTSEGQYFIGTNPLAWSGAFPNCGDHTSLNGNMMIVNAVQAVGVHDTVWRQAVTVLPNTNYTFSTWMLGLQNNNPGDVQFFINDSNIGGLINSSTPSSCNWAQFNTTWNSGNNSTAVITILNKLSIPSSGNDFALDDISFTTISVIKRDSVRITVDTPYVKTTDDMTVCEGIPVQLNTTGAVTYSWAPPTGLTNAVIGNPIATPANTTQYVVTGINANGCAEDDTVTVAINAKPVITITPDDTICKNSTVQLSATGGGTYVWTPATTLNDPAVTNPVASPVINTTYYVTVTGANTCTNTDSVKISIHPDPVFAISPPATICEEDAVQLTASGGNTYTWQADPSLSNTAIANPVASPVVTTNYSVFITENTCNISATLQTTVTVNPLPDVQATSSNDIDCSNDRSQLNATGATTYIWTPSVSLSNPNIANPVATPTGNTQYIVNGTDANGCANYDSVTVNFLAVNTGGYNMPNAFTPNYDGLNDCYGIKYWGVIQELEFSIYNRWGERIFFTKDPNTCWDGIYKGKMQNIGVYVYVIKAKTLCGDTFKKGLFTLAR
ncbi:MAG TPA: gliding motility-associated C-terminal domain-containing protein [Chitinophagaceae bacterium]